MSLALTHRSGPLEIIPRQPPAPDLRAAFARMWDVIWTDPDRELLGEHRAKKEKSDSRKGRNKTKSGRSSMSTTSSQSSTDSPFSIFRSRELRKISSNSASSAKITSSGSSGLASPSFNSTRSPLSQSFDGESCRNCEGGPRSPGRRDRHFEMERYALDGIGNTEQSMENVKSLSLRAVANQGKIQCPFAFCLCPRKPAHQ